MNLILSTDKKNIQLDKLKDLLKQTYWANQRQEATIMKSIEHSLCYGVYADGQMVGFGRVVTDYATMYWICDIIVDETYRHQGIGKMIVEAITQTEEIKGLLGILATNDAHELYAKYGFEREPVKCMMKKRSMQ